MRDQRNGLVARLAIPLLGLLVTAQFLLPEKGIEATASRNDLVAQLRLTQADGIEVLQEAVYSKERLFQHWFFENCFQNRQVWAAFQVLRTGNHSVCLYLVDFRDVEDAAWAKERLNAESADFVQRECEIFGTALVYVQGSPDTPMGVLEGILQTVREKNG